jgi:hypothetical protein
MLTFRPRGHQKVWLRDFLPEDIPECRVLLYGYDSKVPESGRMTRAKEYAMMMRDDLLEFREKTRVRQKLSQIWRVRLVANSDLP